MQEYSSDDFLRMQEQAIQRVKQMQKLSTSNENKPKQSNDIAKNSKQDNFDEDDVKIYQKLSKPTMKIDTNSIQQNREQYEKTAQSQNKTANTNTGDTIKITLPPKHSNKKQMQGPLSAFLSMDNDMALILPLILLLGKEGADDILLLALLYILS